ncbi:MAG TPA: DUF485 domain-containing protein [Chloroflexia bacterium]|nr:DUF485 domain-containing protein [Chloroflexia bacterium]
MAQIGARREPEPGDLTPAVGAATDISPLGRTQPKPAHEQTADEDTDVAAWDQVAAMAEFRALIAAKIRFILPATIFFIIYYFALPVLVGYAPDLMKTRILGPVNLAYLFALSEFFMAWILAYIYLRRASRFDEMAKTIIGKLNLKRGGK